MLKNNKIYLLLGFILFFCNREKTMNNQLNDHVEAVEKSDEPGAFPSNRLLRYEGLPFVFLSLPACLMAPQLSVPFIAGIYCLGLLLKWMGLRFFYDLIHSYVFPVALFAATFVIDSCISQTGSSGLPYFGIYGGLAWAAYIAVSRFFNFGLLNSSNANRWLKLEDLTVVACMVPLLFISITDVNYGSWFALLGFFVPDISRLGYLVSDKVGDQMHNFFNSYLAVFPLLFVVGPFGTTGLMALGVSVVRISLNRLLEGLIVRKIK